jgi:hypothetical protein
MNYFKIAIQKMEKFLQPPYLLLGFIFLFFGKNIIPINGDFIGGFDVGEYFFWHAQFIKEQFLSGTLPLWNPYYYSGHPFLANPQTFIFYPSTLFFIALPLPWAFNLDTVLHLYLAALGMYFLVFLITQSKSSGIAAGVVYCLSGYFMDNILSGHLTMIHTAALLPWIFYFLEKALKHKNIKFFLLSGLMLGLQILSGEPQNNFYSAFFVTFYFMVREVFGLSPYSRQPFHKFGVYFLFIPLVALGVGMVQILPSLEFMFLSDRAKNTYEFATFLSFPPKNFFTLIVPNPKTPLVDTNVEFTAYFGILAGVLAGVGLLCYRKPQDLWPYVMMLLMALTMILGEHTFLYKIYYTWLPGISIFRIPARSLVIFVFGMAVLVGFGVKHIAECGISLRQQRSKLFGLLVLLVCWWVGGKVLQIDFASREMVTAMGLILISFILIIVIRSLKNSKLIAGLLIAVLFGDLFLTYQSQTPILNQSRLTKPFPFETTFQQDPGLYRVAVPEGGLRGMKFHYQGIQGYTPISLDSYFNFIHVMADLPIPKYRRHKLNPEIFRADLIFSSKILGIKYAFVQFKERFRLVMNNQVIPRALLVKDAIPQRSCI